MNRSLVTFCRPRKSLALRRKYLYPPATHFRHRGLRPLCPPRRRRAPALLIADSPKRVRCRSRPPQSEKSPLEKGAVSGADWGSLPPGAVSRKETPRHSLRPCLPLFKGGMVGGGRPYTWGGNPLSVARPHPTIPKNRPPTRKKEGRVYAVVHPAPADRCAGPWPRPCPVSQGHVRCRGRPPLGGHTGPPYGKTSDAPGTFSTPQQPPMQGASQSGAWCPISRGAGPRCPAKKKAARRAALGGAGFFTSRGVPASQST